MRYCYPLIAAACLLAAPLASAAQCGAQGKVKVTAQRGVTTGAGGDFIATGAQLTDEVEGSYLLSNGRWLELVDLDQRLYAQFDKWRRIQLQEVGPHRFASRGGDVNMTYMPNQTPDTIHLSYPADGKGRLARGCS